MGTIKSTVDDASLIAEKARFIRGWAARSALRTLLVVALTGAAILCAQFLYFHDLLSKIKQADESRNQQSEIRRRVLQHRVTLDSITLCLDSEKSDPKLHVWYCKEALESYKGSSANLLPSRVQEIVSKLAYGAMKNEISHQLRLAEMGLHAYPAATREAELLNLLLSKIAIAIYIFVLVIFMIVLYFALRYHAFKNRLPEIPSL